MTQSTLDVAAALFAGIESGRAEDVAAIYADGIKVWHNFDNREQTKAENLESLKGLVSSTGSRRYDVLERLLLPDGRVLQRHDLRVTTRSGTEFVIPACIFITVQDGRIVRIDEYLDTGQANALRKASGREAIGG
jgi:ketosteroid isomerase-like protein